MLLPYLWLGIVSCLSSPHSTNTQTLASSFPLASDPLLNHISSLYFWLVRPTNSSAIYSASKPQLTEEICVCLWFFFT